jgi:hypothetical protein
MSDDNEQPAADLTPEGNPTSGDTETSSAPGPRNPYPPGSPEFIAELKRDLDKTRLPPDLRDEILANEPPLEEQERGYRELMEKGGLSSEEFLASLGLEVEPQP